MRKKIVVGLFVIFSVFLIDYFNVSASCFIDDAYVGDASNANVEHVVGVGDSYSYGNICGPYISFDPLNHDYLTIKFAEDKKKNDVGCLDDGIIGNGSSYNNQFGFIYDLVICPSFIEVTGNEKDNPLTFVERSEAKDVTSKEGKGFYRVDNSNLVTCEYDLSNYPTTNAAIAKSANIIFYKDNIRSDVFLTLGSSTNKMGANMDYSFTLADVDYYENNEEFNEVLKNRTMWFGDSTKLKKILYNQPGNDDIETKKIIDKISEEIDNFDYRTCPNLYVINKITPSADPGQWTYYDLAFSPSETFMIKWQDMLKNHDKENNIISVDRNIYEVKAEQKEYKNTLTNSEFLKLYNLRPEKFDDLFKECNKELDKEKKLECVNSATSLFNDSVRNLGYICNNVYSTCNYNDTAVTWCFDLDKKIQSIRKNFNLEGGACGLSSDLISWIANIFKWVKYVAPALVIILSMVEFIKALASQNDDDMKKVQGKFVRRLIAAALLFIIPFLIEFLLDKFNIVSDNPFCNLIG